MNRTASRTSIKVSTTDAKPASKYVIKKRVERDNRTGQPRMVEHVRGIRI